MIGSYRRIVCLVADGLGIGEAPDAKDYGDEGSNTLGNLTTAVGGVRLSNLEKLGLGNLGSFKGISPRTDSIGLVGKLLEKSKGKDTTTGHWELSGVVTEKALATFPHGFPLELVDTFVKEAGIFGVLGNKASSGTTILSELGEEHLKTQRPILYTSADSVFQVAAHEAVFGLERLYKICHIAREITKPLNIGRVIARPFVGRDKSTFKRTENRRDFSLAPGKNCLDLIYDKGVAVYSVGKIEDIFDHRSITRGNHTGNNRDSLEATLDFLKKSKKDRSFIFTNLVDFDQLYGHRRNPEGYAKSLIELDLFLPQLLSELTPQDLLLITADHGCDPTFKGSDHTREYVPLIAYSPKAKAGTLSGVPTFGDVGATVLDSLGISSLGIPSIGKSFLNQLLPGDA
jgi:phosphopentomutase